MFSGHWWTYELYIVKLTLFAFSDLRSYDFLKTSAHGQGTIKKLESLKIYRKFASTQILFNFSQRVVELIGSTSSKLRLSSSTNLRVSYILSQALAGMTTLKS